MADQGGKDTRGNCISRSASGTGVKLQKILNKFLFGDGSEQKKETSEFPSLLNSGDQVWSSTKGTGTALMRKQQNKGKSL